MSNPRPSMAERIAQAARDFQRRITGHAPQDVKVVLNDKTLVITLYEALTEAERALSQSSEGAARVREFHRGTRRLERRRKCSHRNRDAIRASQA